MIATPEERKRAAKALKETTSQRRQNGKRL
jgi:hypothetical protein